MVFPAVGGVDQLNVRLVAGPLFGERPFRSFRVQVHGNAFLIKSVVQCPFDSG